MLSEHVLFPWTVSDEIDPASRGPNIDARKLAVLEKVYSRPFVGVEGANPIPEAAVLLNQSYQGVADLLFVQLMAQSHLKPLYDLVTYAWDEGTQQITGDLTAVAAQLQAELTTDPVGGKRELGDFVRSVRGFQADDLVGFDSFRQAFAGYGEDVRWTIDSIGQITLLNGAGNDTLTGRARGSRKSDEPPSRLCRRGGGPGPCAPPPHRCSQGAEDRGPGPSRDKG